MEGVVRHFEMSTVSEESQAYICRCEEVSRNDVEKLIDSGITDYEEIRRVLRIGMGPCGGKTCRSVVLQIISEKLVFQFRRADWAHSDHLLSLFRSMLL